MGSVANHAYLQVCVFGRHLEEAEGWHGVGSITLCDHFVKLLIVVTGTGPRAQITGNCMKDVGDRVTHLSSIHDELILDILFHLLEFDWQLDNNTSRLLLSVPQRVSQWNPAFTSAHFRTKKRTYQMLVLRKFSLRND